METSSILLLSISAAVSFGLGRLFVHFRDKNRKKLAQEQVSKILQDQPVEIESRNKSKRKRQLQQLDKRRKGS